MAARNLAPRRGSRASSTPWRARRPTTSTAGSRSSSSAGLGFVLGPRRQRCFRRQQLRNVAPPLLGERDQFLDVVAVRRALGDLALVVLPEPLDDALRIVRLIAPRDEPLPCRLQ